MASVALSAFLAATSTTAPTTATPTTAPTNLTTFSCKFLGTLPVDQLNNIELSLKYVDTGKNSNPDYIPGLESEQVFHRNIKPHLNFLTEEIFITMRKDESEQFEFVFSEDQKFDRLKHLIISCLNNGIYIFGGLLRDIIWNFFHPEDLRKSHDIDMLCERTTFVQNYLKYLQNFGEVVVVNNKNPDYNHMGGKNMQLLKVCLIFPEINPETKKHYAILLDLIMTGHSFNEKPDFDVNQFILCKENSRSINKMCSHERISTWRGGDSRVNFHNPDFFYNETEGDISRLQKRKCEFLFQGDIASVPCFFGMIQPYCSEKMSFDMTIDQTFLNIKNGKAKMIHYDCFYRSQRIFTLDKYVLHYVSVQKYNDLIKRANKLEVIGYKTKLTKCHNRDCLFYDK